MAGRVISYRLLILDDEPLALNLAKRVFEAETDIQLHLVGSPLEALELVRREEIDLVVADQRMPEMNGLTFLTCFRGIQPRALRILFTAYPDLQIALQAINEGLVYRFVLKPWDLDEMRVTIRRALEAKRLADEHEQLSAKLKAQFGELVRAERLAEIGRLSAGIGHELVNAVTPLLAHLPLIEDEICRAVKGSQPLDPTKLNDSLEAMRAAGAQVEALVQGLKRVSREAPEPVPYDVNQAVLSALVLLRHRFKSGIRLERELSTLPAVRCRGSEIAQVLLNLLGNAVDAVERSRGAEVRVRTWHADGKVHVEVSDNGPGIDPAVRNRLFQPFVSTKGPGRGTGLGLSICKSIVESLGGLISVDSEPGRGSRFAFALPVQA